ncbi:3-oxoacyl-[acyl-carrier protein] reductase [Stella humosa]|uniref:3-oxoacyl-[acyl-carrier protein] reductase n=1 Tax=Stella humosa TaxID=94 RepID=A0A3N1L1X8_9PROT|nr:SDR family NAD(P)-dependent oxidoreductase [Stella humosa]ROP84466.1 3-oxoacyl-[acyl-carrier protein] reductase [Stella humosa]BBK33985.1 glucose 1-dehydrogenase [Stella humosa]
MDIHFENRRIVVTGAARGIGQGIARAFAERGGTVFACDLLADELAALARSVAPARGGRIETRAVDLTDGQAVAGFVAEAGADGPVDVLVTVAGGVRGQVPRPIEAVDEDSWRAIYDANVMTAFHAAKAVVPGMKAAGRGRIVTISSGAGLRPSMTGIQSYCSSKHAVVGLSRQLAHELGPFGITVNSIAPGFLRTSPDYERQWDGYGPAGQQALVERIAMRRLGQPEDIAWATLFLASDYASWITGQVLPVSGNPFP